jgi:hypothetical protein
MMLLAAGLGLAAGCGSVPGSTSREQTSPKSAPPLPPDIADSVVQVDELLDGAWRKAKATPAPEVDDATFVRRAYLDLTGAIPTPEQVRAFAASRDPMRRATLIASLVKSPAAARHFTNYWDEILMGGAKGKLIDRGAFRGWLYGELSKGTHWDELVYRLLTASGANSGGSRRDAASWEPDGAPPPEGVVGAVNWFLRGAREPQNLAGAASRIFLGVQIQCAECHDHPTEKWKQEDFRRFTAAFMRVGGEPMDDMRAMGVKRVSIEDVEEPTRRMQRRMERTGYDDADPRALDGTKLSGARPRQELARWITSEKNPWFARALVNRLWSSLLGRGFVEPVDDFRSDSEVRAPAVLDALAADFVKHDFDVRRLVRVICATQAYQRAPAEGAALWEGFRVRPMNADQLLDSLVIASGIEPLLEEVAGERLPQMKLKLRRDMRFTFDVDEETVDDAFTGTAAQALMILNGALTNAGATALEGSTLARAARLPGDDRAAIEALYLAALARAPDAEELEHWSVFLKQAPTEEAPPSKPQNALGRVYRRMQLDDRQPRDAALEDMFWALLASSEFYFIH